MRQAVEIQERQFIVAEPIQAQAPERQFIVGAPLEAIARDEMREMIAGSTKPFQLMRTVEVGKSGKRKRQFTTITREGKALGHRVIDRVYQDAGVQTDWVNIFEQADQFSPELQPVASVVQTESAVGNLLAMYPETQASADTFLGKVALHFSNNRAILTKKGRKGKERLTQEGKLYADAVDHFLNRQFPTLDRTQVKNVISSSLGQGKDAKLLKSSLIGKRNWATRKALFEATDPGRSQYLYEPGVYPGKNGGEDIVLSGAARLNYEINQRIKEAEQKLGYKMDLTQALTLYETLYEQQLRERSVILQRENDQLIAQTVHKSLIGRVREGWRKFRKDVSRPVKRFLAPALAGAAIGLLIGMPLTIYAQSQGAALPESNPAYTLYIGDRQTDTPRVVYSYQQTTDQGDPASAPQPIQVEIPSFHPAGEILPGNNQIPNETNQESPQPVEVKTREIPVIPSRVNGAYPETQPQVRVETVTAEPTPTIENGQTMTMQIGDTSQELVVSFDDNPNPRDVLVRIAPPDGTDNKPTVLRFHSGYMKSIGDFPGTALEKAFENNASVVFSINGKNFRFVPREDPIDVSIDMWQWDKAAWKVWAEKHQLQDEDGHASVIITYCNKYDKVTKTWTSAQIVPGHLIPMK